MRRTVIIAVGGVPPLAVVLALLFVFAPFTGQATPSNIASKANIDVGPMYGGQGPGLGRRSHGQPPLHQRGDTGPDHRAHSPGESRV